MPTDGKRTKQAQQGAQIGEWAVVGSAISVMGLTLAAALASAPADRDLDVVELWAGVASVAGAATRAQYRASAFDLHRVPGVTNVPGDDCEDITTMTGFKAAVALVLRLREGGLLALGPDCSSFTFPNSSRHKRSSLNSMGDLSYFPVTIGNLMAVIAVFLCQLALAHKAHFAMENPSDSHLFRFIDDVCPSFWGRGVEGSQLSVQSVPRCPYDDSPEPKLGKVYKWVSSCSGIKGLNLACTCFLQHRKLGIRRHPPDGIGIASWSGDLKALAESAAYPQRLGEALITMWQKHCRPISAEWSRRALAMEWTDPRDDSSQDTAAAPEASEVGVKKSRRQMPAPTVGNHDQADVKKSRRQMPAPTAGNHDQEDSQDLGPWGVVGAGVKESRCKSPLRGGLGPWSSAGPSTSSSSDSTGSSTAASTGYGPWAGSRVMVSATSSTVALTSARSRTSTLAAHGPWSRGAKAEATPTPTLGPWASAGASSSSSSDEAEPASGQIGSPR